MELMRAELDPESLRSSDLGADRRRRTVEVAGMVTAERPRRRRASSSCDRGRRGSVNLIVPPRVYDRHRRVVRASPLVRAAASSSAAKGRINVLVSEIVELERRNRGCGGGATTSGETGTVDRGSVEEERELWWRSCRGGAGWAQLWSAGALICRDERPICRNARLEAARGPGCLPRKAGFFR